MAIIHGLRYALHVIVHPFDGFWDLKHEKRGNLASALIILAATILAYMGGRQFTAFLFNYNNKQDLSVLADTFTVLLLFFLWCTANWCLTSLMDGEGSYKDIVIASCYALAPYVLITVPLMGLSYCFAQSEASFYGIMQAIAFIWTGGLLFFSTMTTHQYTLGKTVITVICILVGMAIMMFLGLLFFSVVQQMLSFLTILYKEAILRM